MTNVAPAIPTYVRSQAANHQLPGWLRIWCWVVAHANEHGHAPAYAGQLRRDLELDKHGVSRAISQAKARRLIDPCSTAACIVMPGHAIAPCDAIHREGT